MMTNQDLKPCRDAERGNALIIVLIGVVIFAALSFTVSRSMTSSNANQMSEREAAIAASDILNYAQRMQRAVNQLRRNSVSESDISFENEIVAGYTNANCADDTCKVFHIAGASMGWKSPQTGVNDGSEWVITGENCLTDMESGDTPCESDGETSTEELLLILPNVETVVCTAITEDLNIGSTLANADAPTLTQFTGSFADGGEINLAGGPFEAGCFSNGGNNYFYKVLLAR